MDVIGYVWNSTVLCQDCLEADGTVSADDDEVGAIFEDAVSDYPEHCGDCHKFLGGWLTSAGYHQLCEVLLAGHISTDSMLTYVEHYGRLGGFNFNIVATFTGWRLPV